jgi:hypothetical protein
MVRTHYNLSILVKEIIMMHTILDVKTAASLEGILLVNNFDLNKKKKLLRSKFQAASVQSIVRVDLNNN